VPSRAWLRHNAPLPPSRGVPNQRALRQDARYARCSLREPATPPVYRPREASFLASTAFGLGCAALRALPPLASLAARRPSASLPPLASLAPRRPSASWTPLASLAARRPSASLPPLASLAAHPASAKHLGARLHASLIPCSCSVRHSHQSLGGPRSSGAY